MSQEKWSEAKKALHRQMGYRQHDKEQFEKKIRQLENEQCLYQEHFARRFKWWIELIGKNSTPSLPWLIEQDAKFLQSVTQFTW